MNHAHTPSGIFLLLSFHQWIQHNYRNIHTEMKIKDSTFCLFFYKLPIQLQLFYDRMLKPSKTFTDLLLFFHLWNMLNIYSNSNNHRLNDKTFSAISRDLSSIYCYKLQGFHLKVTHSWILVLLKLNC